jgi:hypothetical protein
MIAILAVAVSLAAPQTAAAGAVPPGSAAPTCKVQSFGRGVTLAETTPAGDILDRPEAWSGRQVQVEGEVVGVCEMAGCWMELRAGAGERAVRVKVNDGEIVFPVAARGRRAVAEGTVAVSELDRAAYLRRLQHEADEQGRSFDPATVGAGPFRVLEIKGTGAEICL